LLLSSTIIFIKRGEVGEERKGKRKKRGKRKETDFLVYPTTYPSFYLSEKRERGEREGRGKRKRRKKKGGGIEKVEKVSISTTSLSQSS